MGERQYTPIEFGGGLDRASGVMVIDEASFDDLRNVYLFQGKAEIRRGLKETITFFADEVVLHVHPIRAFGIGAIFTFDQTTREVWLYRSDGAGSTTTGRFLVWTMPVAAGRPRISCDDSYGKLYIAHDEVVFSYRQETKIYDPVTDAITDYALDLYQPTGVLADKVAVRFRGVKRHLNYLVGWGWGTEKGYPASTVDADRPEILRVSMPGEPENMQPLHYAIVGQRYEPIVGCATVNGDLVIRKQIDSHVLIGESRANFGVKPIDELFGAVTGRLMVTVGDRNYFWSLDGPRVSSNGPSSDLALPLNIAGGLPTTLTGAVDAEDGFALYSPQQREILFVFGRVAYVLHLKDETPRWSYRHFALPIGGGGTLYDGVVISSPGGGGGGGEPPGDPPGGVTPTAYPDMTAAIAVGNSQATIEWDNIGTLVGGELAEIWSKPAGGSWAKIKDNIAVAGLTESELISGLTPGLGHYIAARFKLVGVFTAGYTSSNPDNWPLISHTYVVMGAPLAAPTGLSATPICDDLDAQFMLMWDLGSYQQTRIEVSTYGGLDGTWNPVALVAGPANIHVHDTPTPPYDYWWFRFRHETTLGDDVSAWSVLEVGFHPGCPI